MWWKTFIQRHQPFYLWFIFYFLFNLRYWYM